MPLWSKILICVVVIEALGLCAGLITSKSIANWYVLLKQPPGTPPNWLFGPAWTLLYALMGISLALVWHRVEMSELKVSALLLFGAQLILNLAWSPVFFGAHQIGAALVIIVTLLGLIGATIYFFAKLDRAAAWLLVPYICWVAFATYLNAGYQVLNN